MKDPGGFTLIELIIVVAIIGILAAIAIPNFVNLRERADEAAVRSNVHTVQLAVELYGARTGGTYAGTVADDAGYGTIVDSLPQAALLTNPFTNIADSPVDGIAASVGRVGYSGNDNDGDGNCEGYIVTGFGAQAEVMRISSGL